MDLLQKHVMDNPTAKYVIAGVVATVSTMFVIKKIRAKVSGSKKTSKVYCPPGSVLLFQIGRGPYAPSMSPFPLKLETYLRMADIPYVNDMTGIMSDKRKTPWIMYNGERVPDSQFSIEFLNKKFNKDLNKHLSKEDRASAEALRIMIDEHLYWPLVYFRWVEDTEMAMLKTAFKIPKFLLRYISKQIKGMLHGQGVGRHTCEEIHHILHSDLQVISDYLGEKAFLTGDTPCEVDCSAFGMLCQLLYHETNPKINCIVKEEFPSLVQYCERMKERVWPDWDECITKGGTQKATK